MKIINKIEHKCFVKNHEVGKIYTPDYINFFFLIEYEGSYGFVNIATGKLYEVLLYSHLSTLDKGNQIDYEVDAELILHGIK